MTINFQYYPKNNRIPLFLEEVVSVFNDMNTKISIINKKYKSNDILKECRDGLRKLNYEVEGKHGKENFFVEVPVLFGKNNKLEKSFRADAYNREKKSVIEIEAGRGVLNNQFLKDLFQACLMQDVEYLTIAVLNEYKTATSSKNDFEEVCKFFDALYASDRLKLPLKGVLIVGYDLPLIDIEAETYEL